MQERLAAIVVFRVLTSATKGRGAPAMGKILIEAVCFVINRIVERAVIAFSIATVVALFAWPSQRSADHSSAGR